LRELAVKRGVHIPLRAPVAGVRRQRERGGRVARVVQWKEYAFGVHTHVDVDVPTWSDCGRTAIVRAGNGLEMETWRLRVSMDKMMMKRRNYNGGHCIEVDIRKREPAKR
jgi:hypothetical protein